MNDADKPVLATVEECVKAAGGDTVVAKRFGYRDGRAVWNWRDRGYFPPSTYELWQEILSELGKTAPRSLWRWREHVAAE